MKTLFEILEEARKYKFIGPLPIESHIRNGEGFLEVLTGLSPNINAPHLLVDIGSGGGIPAFVIAEKYPHWNFLLVERKKKRANFLSWVVDNTKFGENIEVFLGEAEIAARNKEFEGKADFVTARSFAPPPKTAECGCRFLQKGGHMVVSEPPKAQKRWPTEELSLLGLRAREVKKPNYGTFQILELVHFPEQK